MEIYMEQFTEVFLEFINSWGYFAVSFLMALENACIPIPSELILGFGGYLIFIGKMSFSGALFWGMVGGLVGSLFAYYVGKYGGRPFVDQYGKYFLMKKSHVDSAQHWFDTYGISAVFFSRMLPVIRTFISLPAGFAGVNLYKFVFYTILGSLPWTALILYIGMALGENWQVLRTIGHEVSIVFIILMVIVVGILYFRRKQKR